MKKVILTNAQYLELDVELNGQVNNETGETRKGLLQETLPIKVRYWASRINSKIEGIKSSINAAQQELIKKYGEEKDGGFSVDRTIKEKDKEVINPNFLKYLQDLDTLLLVEEEIEVPELSIEDLGSFETSVNLNILFKLVD